MPHMFVKHKKREIQTVIAKFSYYNLNFTYKTATALKNFITTSYFTQQQTNNKSLFTVCYSKITYL